MCGFYEPDTILVSANGEPQRGAPAIRAELLKYYSAQLPMVIIARHILVADTIASLVLDWNIVGKTPTGQDFHMVATSNDIARRGPDGYWWYIIDNPFGTRVRHSPDLLCASGPGRTPCKSLSSGGCGVPLEGVAGDRSAPAQGMTFPRSIDSQRQNTAAP